MYKRRGFLPIFVALMVLSASACTKSGEEKNWTKEDYEFTNHYYASQRDNKEASRIARQAGNQFSKEQLSAIRALTVKALAESRLVPDKFLDKIHPQFKDHFRNQFEVALDLALNNLDTPDYQTAQRSSVLFSDYADWFTANQEDIKFPH
ncbi:MAG: hypothetical protein HY280_06680 [Nitrospinae bacterium]|nr:hypothetical protein [Nitrospinota bacterium]